jgi:Undecaprenyl-phosphate glucose phosphotransferase
MFRERSDELRYTLAVIDLVLSFLAFAFAFALRFGPFGAGLVDLGMIDVSSYVFFGVLLSVSQVIAFSLLGLYRLQKFLSFLDEVGIVVGGTVLNFAFSFAILYYLKIYEVSRLLPLFYGVSLIVLVSLGHSIFRRFLWVRRLKGQGLHDLLIVGASDTAQRTADALERNLLLGYRVIGFVQEDGRAKPAVPKEKILGKLSELNVLVEHHHPGDLIYAGDHGSEETLAEVLEICDRNGIQLHVVPGFGNLVTANGLLENLNGLPLISIRDIPARSGFNRVLKRTFDIVFSGLFLLVFSPVYLLIALAVKLTSRGPVFFTQERVGLDNQVFKIIKFRTMRVQEAKASDTVWTTKDDPRITPIGKFLRKSSLDEIPQFFNIFVGQMSVVGPRPERPFYVEQFKDRYHYFKRRHSVKAGLTGWAQINGLRGDTSIQDRIDADLYYIENWTFYFDLKIVVLTPFKGMIHKNAY